MTSLLSLPLALDAWIPSAVVTFAMVSFLLRKYPSLVWRRKRRYDVFDVRRIGHRGDRTEFAENTLEAFQHAAKYMDMIELDVFYTKDDKIVVFHDGDLRRCCGVDGHVNDLAFADLPALRLPTEDAFLQGYFEARNQHRFSKDKKTNGKPQDEARSMGQRDLSIPLLGRVLDLAAEKNVGILIEIKEKRRTKKIVREIHEMVRARGLLNKTVWFSLSGTSNATIQDFNRALERTGRGAETLPTLPSVPQVLKIVVMYYLGFLPFLDVPIELMGIPIVRVPKEGERLPFQDRVPLPTWLYRRVFGAMKNALLSRRLCDHLRARGIPIWVLNVNPDNICDIDEPRRLGRASRSLRTASRLGMTACLSDSAKWLIISAPDEVFTRV